MVARVFISPAHSETESFGAHAMRGPDSSPAARNADPSTLDLAADGVLMVC